MIAIAPKAVQLAQTLTGYAVRGSYDAAGGLVSFSVHFHVTGKDGKPTAVHPALRPANVRHTAAEFDAIVATPHLPGETNQAWLERATASLIQGAYGLTPAVGSNAFGAPAASAPAAGAPATPAAPRKGMVPVKPAKPAAGVPAAGVPAAGAGVKK
jgi:hypothetical protein